ncbi:MAG TPA: penicillin-binding transpeptidase domain-containing protein [Thermomicrobiales bacterium]|nr:penicillin-binding transpeptidase domain-containing protein [Thermomicrobiales bacterium]
MPVFVRILAALASISLLGWGLYTIDDVSDARWLSILGVAWLLLLAATYVQLPAMPEIPRSLIRVALVFATVIAIISVQLIRIQVIQQDEIAFRTAISADGSDALANPRVVLTPLETARGEIVDRDDEVIASTIQEGDLYYRIWPDPATAYVAGYFSPFLVASAGLEATYADVLAGQTKNDPVRRLFNNLLHQPQVGSDLRLTLDSDLQRAAHEMLGGQDGAVVVVDVDTGDVLVLASNPNYDPNQLFTTSPSENPMAQSYWDALVGDPNTPLVSRATIGLFTPGSTFKTVTAAIALERGYAEPDTVYEDDGDIEIDGRVLVEANRPDESRTEWTLREGLMWSLNVVLAQVGLQIGGDTFWEDAQKFGFGEEIPFALPTSISQLASSEAFLDSRNAVADTGFGQGQIQVTPLHMALITAAYANNGVMMEPRLVDQIIAPSGGVVETLPAREWLTPISAETAIEVRSMMIDTVASGSAQLAQVPDYTMGGKTGTAETSGEAPHSWFIGFIGDTDSEPRYAVAVVLEEGGTGLSGPIGMGRDMLVQAMQQMPSE